MFFFYRSLFSLFSFLYFIPFVSVEGWQISMNGNVPEDLQQRTCNSSKNEGCNIYVIVDDAAAYIIY
jgi:hypothetical protein